MSAITIAGQSNIAGTSNSLLNSPACITFDASNTVLYISDSSNNRVQKWILGTSVGTTIAGQNNGTNGSSLAYLNSPRGIQVDINGNLYIADMHNHRVVMWSNGASTGTIVAGNGKQIKKGNRNITNDFAIST